MLSVRHLSIITTLILASSLSSLTFAQRTTYVIDTPITYEAQTTHIEVVGTSEAERSITLYSQVTEFVTQMHFSANQAVKKGDLIIELDHRREDVQAELSQAQLKDAERNLERVRQVHKSKGLSEQELNRAELTRDLMFNRHEEALVNLNERLIRAPFDGIIGLSDIETGDRITTSMPIVSLDDRRHLYINISVPEAGLPMLIPNNSVSVTPWINPKLVIEGTIVEVDSRVDPETHTVRARIRFPNIDDTYRPGMSFQVFFEQVGNQYAKIPESALMWGNDGPFVWLLRDNKAHKSNVSIIERQRGFVLADTPSLKTDRLIIEGIQRLRQGQTVTVKNKEG